MEYYIMDFFIDGYRQVYYFIHVDGSATLVSNAIITSITFVRLLSDVNAPTVTDGRHRALQPTSTGSEAEMTSHTGNSSASRDSHTGVQRWRLELHVRLKWFEYAT